MICKKLIYLISFVVVLSLAGDAQADWISWNDASGDHDWLNEANWDGGIVPASGDGANIKGEPGPIIQGYDVQIGGVKQGHQGLVCPVTVDDATVRVSGAWSLGAEYSPAETLTLLNMISGEITANDLLVSNHSPAILNMTGGAIKCHWRFLIGVAPKGIGHVNLDGGTITADQLVMRLSPGSVGTMNVKGGTLILNGNRTATVQGYIDDGWITAYGGDRGGTLHLDYDVTNRVQTTLRATHTLNPNPLDGSVAGAGPAQLLWTLPEPNRSGEVIDCTVYFGTDPAVEKNPKVVVREAVESVSVALEAGTIYYWALDLYDSSISDTEPYWQAPIFTFKTAGNLPPIVNAGDVAAWLYNGERVVGGVPCYGYVPEGPTTHWTHYFSLARAKPGPMHTPALLNLMEGDENGMAHYMGMIPGIIGPASVLPVASLLDKEDWYPRWSATVSLEMMGPQAESALPALEETFLDEQEDIDVRVGAARAIARIRGTDPFDLYKRIPNVEQRIIAASNDKSMARRQEFMMREGARTDVPDNQWSLSARCIYSLTTGQNVATANASIKQWAESADAIFDLTSPMNMVRVFVMFSSKNRFGFESRGRPGLLTVDSEEALKTFFFNQLDNVQGTNNIRYTPKTSQQLPDMEGFDVLDTANGPLRTIASHYLSLSILKEYPEYAQRQFAVGDTVTQRYEAYSEYLKRFLKDWALHGMWIELGSSNYEYRTYSALFNLVDLSLDPVVRQRAKMFLDLSLIEIEQISISGVRGGSKSRCKSGGLGSGLNPQLAMLYGERGSLSHQGQLANSDYQAPAASILLRKLGPPVASFEIANRRPAEMGSDGRYVKLSRCMNYAYRTPEYVIGSSMLDADVDYTAASEGRWGGVMFRNLAAISLEPYLGDRWNVQSKNVLIAQRYKDPSMDRGQPKVVFESRFKKVERDGWVFVDNGEAFAAVRVVTGGYSWLDSRKNVLNLNDPTSPIIIQTGVSNSFGRFQQRVLNAPLTLDYQPDGTLYRVEYTGPNSNRLEFFPAPAPYILPKIDGAPIDLDLEYNYNSPYVQCSTGSDIVTVRYGAWRWDYDFANSTVTETEIVNAGDDVATWLDSGERVVQLDGFVSDDGGGGEWSVIAEPDELNPAEISDPLVPNPSVTVKEPGSYTLQLEALDGEVAVADTMQIVLYADSCEHARNQGGFEWLAGDFNHDCKVDFLDVFKLGASWLSGDVGDDYKVDFLDFAGLGASWLQENYSNE